MEVSAHNITSHELDNIARFKKKYLIVLFPDNFGENMINPNKTILMTTLLSDGVLLDPLNRCGFPSILQEPKGWKAIPKAS